MYDGDFKFGKPHGHGIRSFSDGTVYDGQWDKAKMHGVGKKTGKSLCCWRAVQEGTWKEGQYRGKESFVSSNAKVLEDEAES